MSVSEKYSRYAPVEATAVLELPAHWVAKRMRFVCNVNPAMSKRDPPSQNTIVSFVPMESVGEYGGLTLDAEKAILDIGTRYTYFEDGDVVVAKITPCFENGKGALAAGLTNGKAYGTTELHVIRAGQELDPRFLFYVTISGHFRATGESEMYGAGGQKRVPESFLKNFRIVIPPISEQRTVVDYLDRQTSRVDALVAKRRCLADLLDERYSRVLTAAVTTGLDPAFAKKKSGIEHVPEIPRHWSSARLAMISTKLGNGFVGPTRDILRDEGICYLQSLHIKRGKIDFERRPYFVSEEWAAANPRVSLKAGDVLVVQTGEIGQVAAVPETFAGACCHALIIVRFQAELAYGPFVAAYLNSSAGSQTLKSLTTGALHPHLECSNVREIRVPLPPIAEQRSIVDYLNREEDKAASAQREIGISIARLLEHRAAPVTNAVTGKIDVRSHQQREAAE